MRHRIAGYKLGRDAEHRRADRRNLAVALFTHSQITTTLPKAKMVQPFIEKLITAAKKGDLASRRRVIAELQDRIMVDTSKEEDDQGVKRNKYGELMDGPRVVKKLFDEIAPTFGDRPGGYTRIIKLAGGHRLRNSRVLKSSHRIGDGSDLCVLQLVSSADEGPQVPGQYSRRREKANGRMEFAAKLRKASKTQAAPAAEAPAPAADQESVKSE